MSFQLLKHDCSSEREQKNLKNLPLDRIFFPSSDNSHDLPDYWTPPFWISRIELTLVGKTMILNYVEIHGE